MGPIYIETPGFYTYTEWVEIISQSHETHVYWNTLYISERNKKVLKCNIKNLFSMVENPLGKYIVKFRSDERKHNLSC